MWLKLSDDFDDDLQGLSSDAFRVHIQGLLYVMRREKSPVITRREVRRFADVDEPEKAIRELLDAGFWVPVAEGNLRIKHHMEHQIEPEVIAARKALNAERQKRHRLKKAGISSSEDPPEGETVTRYETRDPGRDGSGQVGSGRAQRGEQPAWPETQIPGSGWPEHTMGAAINER